MTSDNGIKNTAGLLMGRAKWFRLTSYIYLALGIAAAVVIIWYTKSIVDDITARARSTVLQIL